MLKKIFVTALAVAGLSLFAPQSQAAVKLGVLTCSVEGGWTYVVGSNKAMSCVYTDRNGRVRTYQGHISKVGIDVGYTGTKTIAWAVFSVNNHKKGSLRGVYTGANAEASALVGVGANVLVGASDENFMLQPLSGQVQTGLNLALAVQSLSLH
jgi:hypothetical protein